jgi:hypothetical protein
MKRIIRKIINRRGRYTINGEGGGANQSNDPVYRFWSEIFYQGNPCPDE